MDSSGRIVIFGATGSIGSSIARRLVFRNRRVLLVGRNAEKLATLSEELDQPFCAVKFEHSAEVENAIKSCCAGDHATGVVNCVGSLLLKPAHLTSDDEFREVFETNLFTAFLAVRLGAALMRSNGGSIVLFSSAAAEIGIHSHEAIAAAKAGVAGLTRSAAASYATNNIRVNAISPGLVQTELTKRIWGNPNAAAASRQMHALGRLGEPEKVASLAEWLLDEENDWITGQVIGIDGGLGNVIARR